jgi:hypothetical protein
LKDLSRHDWAYAYLAALGFPSPIYAHEISVLLERVLNFAVEGALDRLANAPRQVNIRRVDHDPLGILRDANDPVERMLLLLCLPDGGPGGSSPPCARGRNHLAE